MPLRSALLCLALLASGCSVPATTAQAPARQVAPPTEARVVREVEALHAARTGTGTVSLDVFCDPDRRRCPTLDRSTLASVSPDPVEVVCSFTLPVDARDARHGLRVAVVRSSRLDGPTVLGQVTAIGQPDGGVTLGADYADALLITHLPASPDGNGYSVGTTGTVSLGDGGVAVARDLVERSCEDPKRFASILAKGGNPAHAVNEGASRTGSGAGAS